jgi:glycosyltransferase involved in cell wall biosynthesis
MIRPSVSLILPFRNQADYVIEIVQGHIAMLNEIGISHEIILVPNGSVDNTNAVCRRFSVENPNVRCIEIDGCGWGYAVRSGISAAQANLICYTNSARTQSHDLSKILTYALQNPGSIVKARRFDRHSRIRHLGSLLYNYLCGMLFNLSTRDVNGTPKAFPRSALDLRALQRNDDLIDLEFMWCCRKKGLAVVEISVFGDDRRGGTSTTGWRTAWRLYTGAVRYWFQIRTEGGQ